MKIEKLNDHQIRCTLTRSDLEQREIHLSELAYGSEKTKMLFRDMMQQAFDDFGFDVEEVPLMIEAIPLSSDVIVLIISKVDSPDELDTRFSRFTQAAEGADSDRAEGTGSGNAFVDLDELLKKVTEVRTKDTAAANKKADSKKPSMQKVRIFSFDTLDSAIALSQALRGFYQGENTIYRDNGDRRFHLVMRQSGHSPAEFNRVSHLASEYLIPEKYTPGTEAYYREHLEVLIQDQALQKLASL